MPPKMPAGYALIAFDCFRRRCLIFEVRGGAGASRASAATVVSASFVTTNDNAAIDFAMMLRLLRHAAARRWSARLLRAFDVDTR